MLDQRFFLIDNFIFLGFSFGLSSVRIEGIEKEQSRVNAECLIIRSQPPGMLYLQ
jgi:hypothetical protein